MRDVHLFCEWPLADTIRANRAPGTHLSVMAVDPIAVQPRYTPSNRWPGARDVRNDWRGESWALDRRPANPKHYLRRGRLSSLLSQRRSAYVCNIFRPLDIVRTPTMVILPDGPRT
jgi:hypothetical protein